MLERVEHEYLLIQGFRGGRVIDPAVTLKTLRERFPTIQIQVMRSDRVAGQEHLYFSVRNALRAFKQGYQRSKTEAMEVLLYASCHRQISRAIKSLGLSSRTRNFALVAVSRTRREFPQVLDSFQKLSGAVRDDDVLLIKSQKKLEGLKRIFRISKSELEAARTDGEPDEETVKRLIIERSALLALEG